MRRMLSRRAFLETSSKGLVAVTAVPYLLRHQVPEILEAPMSQVASVTDFMNHFGVDEKTIQKVMAVALSQGGDYCDLFFEHTISNYLGLEDKEVNRAYNNIDFGVGIRVLKGDQTGYSFTEEVTPAAMELAAKTAANVASSARTMDAIRLAPRNTPNYYVVKTPWEQVAIDKKIPYLQKINDQVFTLDKRIIKCNISFSNDTSYVLIATSEGKVVHDYRPMGMIYVNCSAEQSGRREENYYGLGGRTGIEFFTPEVVETLAREGVRRTVDLFEAVKPEAGEMEVVLAAGSSGILLHEAIGHGMEADFNRKKISIFSDKLNKPVAEQFVTIVDDGTNPNSRGSLNVDDEGNDTEKTLLVENGIMHSYLHDRISAKHYGVKSTGSGRRQSFRFSPVPRMRNTYMLPGPHKKEEIIKSVKKGLYAEAFTNGQVSIGAGDFTFYVKSGNLIENGKLTRPVKDVNIIGNGPKVLRDTVMVADDFKMDEGGWTCGKDGQGVPVSLGLPTIKVSKITVGGVNA
jgi:TldD protein